MNEQKVPVNTLQEALQRLAQHIGAKWVFDEASVALDEGRDYKLTITCTEIPKKGFVVAMHRHQTERVGHNSFIKLSHGEWEASNVE
jgi:ABC-type transport system involved in cytochrome c biogenesis ATPase subunit